MNHKEAVAKRQPFFINNINTPSKNYSNFIAFFTKTLQSITVVL